MADRVETVSLCHKAREEAKGGPLGNERNDVARAHSLNPSGWGLLGPMTALHLLAWGATQAASARLVLEPNRPQRDRQTNVHRP